MTLASEDSPMDRQLEAILHDYLQSVDAGQAPDRDALLQQHPKFATELAAFFAAQNQVEQLAAPLRPVAGPNMALYLAPTLSPGPKPTETPLTRVRYFGDYQLLDEIARGGMGVVYRARQVSLNRIVALKMILAGNLASAEDVRRFHVEAEAAAKLDHPGIVPVFEVGEHEGQHYFSMGFVEGESLAQRVAKGILPPRTAADLTKRIALAVSYAHSQGVIHRDLKPANVLLDKEGQPRVTDFGLAKRILTEAEQDAGSSQQHTATGAALGTPSYMPPEQAGGRSAEIGPLSDVYSLGAIFYCLITGRPPFQAATPLDTLMQVIDQEPVPPRQLNASIPRDMETICLKCLEKEPRNRYGSARELIDELERFLAGEPIQARPVSNPERLWRWCKRRPLVASLAGAVAALLLVGLVGSLIVAGHERALRSTADEARNAAEEAQSHAESSEKTAQGYLYAARMNLAQQAWETGNINHVRELLDFYRHPNSEAQKLRGWEWYYQDRLCQGDLRTFEGHTNPVYCVAFSPNGAIIASAGYKTIKLWDVATGSAIHTINAPAAVSVAFSPDGKSLAAACGFDGVMLWDTATGKLIRTLIGTAESIDSVAFSPDGARIAGASVNSTVRLWHTATGIPTNTFKDHTGSVTSVAFSHDGTRLVTGSGDKTVKLWDARTGRVIHTFKGHEKNITCVAFSPDGTRIASSSEDQTLKLWNAATGNEILTFKGHTKMAFSVAFSPDGTRIASGSEDNTVKLWDALAGNEIRTLKGHSRVVFSVAFSPDGAHIATGGGDNTVKLWDTASDQEFRTLRCDASGIVACVVFSPNGTRLASTQGVTVKLWDAGTGSEIRTFKGHANSVNCVAFSPDGTRVASGGYEGVILWDAASCNEIRSFKGGRGTVNSVAFSPDGGRLATAHVNNIVKLWDATGGIEIYSLKGHQGPVHSVAFSPDGVNLASASADRTIKLWEAATGKEIRTIRGHQAPILSVAFSPDGSRLASACTDSTVKLWDAATGQEIRTLKGHALNVFSVVFSPDGTRLASASMDDTVKLWDAATGNEIRSLKGHAASVRSVAFSPDGTRIASASNDMTVKFWDATPLTPAVREDQEAIGLLAFFVHRALSSKEIIANLQIYKGITDSVRQKALARANTYGDQRTRDLAEKVVEEQFKKLFLRSEVLEAIQSQKGIPEEAREKALVLAKEYPENAMAINEAAWQVVRFPEQKPESYTRALFQAEAANRLRPENGAISNTLGVAQYRAGLFAQALETLQRSEKLNAVKAGSAPSDLAFLAMSYHQLGRKDEAHATLDRLREAMKMGKWTKDAGSLGFLREAETLLGADPTPKKN